MRHLKETLDHLNKKVGTLSQKKALVGFDGFIDAITRVVDQRFGPGEAYSPINTIDTFGDHIKNAAGKGTNFELVTLLRKIGGNGPIMANALMTFNIKTRYIGSLGYPTINPVFEEFCKKADVCSIAEPSYTAALEFDDGKIMLGKTENLEKITYEAIVEKIGEGMLLDHFSRADLIGLVNWTMLPHMSSILNNLLDYVFPAIGPHADRVILFDLADPQKRSAEDLSGVLNIIKRFQAHGGVTLCLNKKEAFQVYNVLFNHPHETENDEAFCVHTATEIQQALEVTNVVVRHPRGAACAQKQETVYAENAYVEKPKISTGCGDVFNAGFMLGQLLQLAPIHCLNLGNGASGYYVRNMRPPTLSELTQFLNQLA
ncbi:MAG: sugar kinase [Verrucomicrobia bacterium CG_4_10_14_3_um_filter_43_23]|nr:MAG: hypothetical protein AUJ82_03955 [Verrucomicrobia bacterium CG1_02_43_26]PIP58503.1 MAG: sugar kinase [Verrucomicrobia bacterium CG22_combo_CG10-13_8_21_14_all_43_17]PIX58176.1 MAG: sugar kinase [Verrucomicrobia bacterium CG_4_10_14_3_um_filter_43_23]PJA43383.1 MAG: sugar kinase [Verrucomicrobia bacterium CG_4_9_14_3_um_filter_43_20]